MGSWIKLEHATPDKPEVVRMAQLLKIDQDAVLGKLIRIWIWADTQTVNGDSLTVADQFLDRITSARGFAVALRKVGWLSGRDGRLALPNFNRHNGQTAKDRADTARRVARHRAKGSPSCNDPPLHEPLQKPLPDKDKELEKDKAINRLGNRSVEKDSEKTAGGTRSESEFMALAIRLFSKPEMAENGGLWRTLFRENPGKAWRVIEDVRVTLASSPAEIKTTPAQFAMDLWKRFK